MKKIAIISDTHGKLPSKVFKIFDGVDLILHAGDIGDKDILTQLESIAKVEAVFGNMDDFSIREITKKELTLTIEGFKIHLSHEGKVDTDKFDIVIQGHSHKLECRSYGKKFILNPGSANSSQSIPKGEATALILKLKQNEIMIAKTVFL